MFLFKEIWEEKWKPIHSHVYFCLAHLSETQASVKQF